MDSSQFHTPRTDIDWSAHVSKLDLLPEVTTCELYEVRALAGCYLAGRMLERVPSPAIYSGDLARVIHKAMFGGVYRFAGQFRRADQLARIGESVSTAHPERIERELRLLELQGKELASAATRSGSPPSCTSASSAFTPS